MSTLLFAAAVCYIVFAILKILSRPGFFAAVYLLSFGLSTFFGSIGPIAGAISIFVSLAAINSRKEQQTLVPGELPFALWVGMFMLSIFATPHMDVTSVYVGSILLLAVGSFLYARAFAAQPNFFEDLLFGSLFVTAVCAIQITLQTSKLGVLGDTDTTSHVGLAILPELCLVGTMCYLMFHRGHSRFVTFSLLAYAVFVLLPLIMALGTRSVVLSSGAVFAVLVVLRMWHGGVAKLLLGVGASAAATAAIIAVFWSDIENTKMGVLVTFGAVRLSSGLAEGGVQADPSAMERLGFYDEGWDIFFRHPIFGNGAGAFGYLADGAAGGYPHNMIIEILVQSGVFGLLLFILFCVPLGFRGVREALQKPSSWSAVFGLSLLVSALIRHQVSMSIAQGKLLFFSLGCFAALYVADQRAARSSMIGDTSAITSP